LPDAISICSQKPRTRGLVLKTYHGAAPSWRELKGEGDGGDYFFRAQVVESEGTGAGAGKRWGKGGTVGMFA